MGVLNPGIGLATSNSQFRQCALRDNLLSSILPCYLTSSVGQERGDPYQSFLACVCTVEAGATEAGARLRVCPLSELQVTRDGLMWEVGFGQRIEVSVKMPVGYLRVE